MRILAIHIHTWHFVKMSSGLNTRYIGDKMFNLASKLIPTVSESQYLVSCGKALYQSEMSVILRIGCGLNHANIFGQIKRLRVISMSKLYKAQYKM